MIDLNCYSSEGWNPNTAIPAPYLIRGKDDRIREKQESIHCHSSEGWNPNTAIPAPYLIRGRDDRIREKQESNECHTCAAPVGGQESRYP